MFQVFKSVIASLLFCSSFAFAGSSTPSAYGQARVYNLQVPASHMVITITGQAARNLYDQLQTEVLGDMGEGVTQKSTGSVLCTKVPHSWRLDEYICEIVVDEKGAAQEAGVG